MASSPSSYLGAYVGNPNGNDRSAEADFESRFQAFSDTLGTTPKFMNSFIDPSLPLSQWAENAGWNAWSWSMSPDAKHLTPVIGLPMATNGDWNNQGQVFRDIASGKYDDVWKGIVGNWKANGFSTIYVRVGYEVNGNFMPWYVGDDAQTQAEWVAAFRHMADVLHGVPGADVKVVWNPNAQNWTSMSVASLYPGDPYVDVVADDVYSPQYPRDLYDWSRNDGTIDSSFAQWSSDPANRTHYWTYPSASQWNRTGADDVGWSLKDTINLANAHGKPVGVAESGAGGDGATNGPSDDPAFPQWLASELASASRIAFANVWDVPMGDGNWDFTSGSKPQEAAAWARYFGGGSRSDMAVPSGADNAVSGAAADPASTAAAPVTTGTLDAGDPARGMIFLGSGVSGTGDAPGNRITGGTGDDTLEGGAGADTLTGGADDDVFVFHAGEANGDVVTDFSLGGSGGMDALLFEGYGSAGQGASFTRTGASDWTVSSQEIEMLTQDDTQRRSAKATHREWAGLAVLALPCILYAMDLTILNLAIPSLTAELKPTAAQLLWIVDIYGFLAAGALLIMGALGDRIGRRKLLMVGSAAFAAVSFVAAFSKSAEMLIAARGLLGITGATMAPSTLSLISNIFQDEREKTFAISVWVASFSLGGAIGPFVGGAIIANFWWGAVFLAPIPIMALLLIAGPALLPEHRGVKAGRIDIVSAILTLATVLPISFAIKHVAEGGDIQLAGLAAAAGTGCGVVFVRRQLRLADPLLDVRLFRVRALSVALIINALDFLVGFGILVLAAQYLQLVLDLSPFEAGLWSVPPGLGFVAGSLLTSALLKVLRPAYVLGGGLIAGAAGLALMACAVEVHSLVLITLGNTLFAVGSAPGTTVVADFVVGAAPKDRSAAASALSETCSEFGGALGIALLGSLATFLYRHSLVSALPSTIPASVASTAMRGIGAARAASQAISGGSALLDAAKHAYTSATAVALLTSAGLTVLTAVLAVTMLKSSMPVEGDATVDVGPA